MTTQDHEWSPRPTIDDREVQQVRHQALTLAVETFELVEPLGGLVPTSRQAVLDTAEVYLKWITAAGERP